MYGNSMLLVQCHTIHCVHDIHACRSWSCWKLPGRDVWPSLLVPPSPLEPPTLWYGMRSITRQRAHPTTLATAIQTPTTWTMCWWSSLVRGWWKQRPPQTMKVCSVSISQVILHIKLCYVLWLKLLDSWDFKFLICTNHENIVVW